MILYILFGIISIGIVIILYRYLKKKSHTQSHTQSYTQSHTQSHKNITIPEFRGLVLFDVDHTLTTGNHNEEVVQYCLDTGWAVGICTAGSIYSMDNLMSFSWMPRNLYDFMRTHNSMTFNNVASGILKGKFEPQAYNNLSPTNSIDSMEVLGYRKGFALVETGRALGITDPTCLILCDDRPDFMQGALHYNPNLNMACSGEACGGVLNVNTLEVAMKKCNDTKN